MRTFLNTIAILILFPLACHAQSLIQLGANVGMSSSKISGFQLSQKGMATGIMGSVKLLADFKHWQVGACVELSSIKGDIYAPTAYRMAPGEYLILQGTRYNDIANPMIAPQLFVNYKLKLGKKLYCYAGGLFGLPTAKNDFVIRGSIDGYMVGLNAGAVYDLNETISLDVNHGWRYADFKTKPEIIQSYIDGLPNSFRIHSFPLQVGIRVRFAN